MKSAILMLLVMFSLETKGKTRVAIYTGEAKAQASGHTNQLTIGKIFDTPLYKLEHTELRWGVDASYWHWNNDYGNDYTGGAITPTFYYQHPLYKIEISYRLGVGLAYIEDTHWHTRNLGDNWLFENKLEIGLHFNRKHSILAMICHYSNANLNQRNDGLDIISIGYQYQF